VPLCPNKINSCVCDDDPLANYSSEDLYPQVFCAVVNFTGDPGLGQCFSELSAKDVCCSLESEQDAQLCALQRAQVDVFNTWAYGSCPPPPDVSLGCSPPCLPEITPPEGPVIPVFIYYNQAVDCSAFCKDDLPFTWSVAAGKVVSVISQADADAKAVALACQLAKRNKLCFFDNALAPACVGVFYEFQLDGVGGFKPYVWSLAGGSFPTGITMDSDGNITGTPTTGGVSTVQILLTDNIGSTQIKTFTLTVAEISPSTLPDATIGTFYQQALSVSPAHSSTDDLWTVVSGTLPPGLDMADDGVIIGTPTGAGASYHLGFQVDFTMNGQKVRCSKDYTFTVNDPPPPPVTTNCPVSPTLNNLPVSVRCPDFESLYGMGTFGLVSVTSILNGTIYDFGAQNGPFPSVVAGLITTVGCPGFPPPIGPSVNVWSLTITNNLGAGGGTYIKAGPEIRGGYALSSSVPGLVPPLPPSVTITDV